MNKFGDKYKSEMGNVKPSVQFKNQLVNTLKNEQRAQKRSRFTTFQKVGFGFAAAATVSLVAGGIILATGNKSAKPGSFAGQGTIVNKHLTTYGEKITVEDIKKAYAMDDSKEIMPLYNVSQSENFTFNFKFNGGEEHIDIYDYVTVHTDYECKPESAIYYYSHVNYNDDDTTTVNIAPMEPILHNEEQQHNYVYNDKDSWGNAPMYYLAIHYDLESEKITKLEEPVVIPFTVKNEVDAPNAKGYVDPNNGRFKLVWEPVAGAEKYKVYKLTDSKLNTGVDNHAIDGSKVGYKELYMLYEAETTECEFNNFAGAHHGIAQIEDSIKEYKVGDNTELNDEGVRAFTIGQNYCVNGEYFVTAVVNGVESGISAPIKTADLKIPYEIEEEKDILFNHYNDESEFPTEVEVTNIDGSKTMHPVRYEKVEGVNYLGYYTVQYNYHIEGTAITGYVYPENLNTEPRFVGVPGKDAGDVKPEDNVNKTPGSDVDTIIDPDSLATPGDASAEGGAGSNLVDVQKDNTQNHIKLGNKKQVENVAEGIYVIADSAEEEWLALNLIQANESISVEAFVALQDPYRLVDTLEKVCTQNPFILGVTAYSYDYNTFTVKIEYSMKADEIAKKQAELIKKAADVLAEIVNKNMSDEEKVVAIYNYLRGNVKYDDSANDAAKENEYVKDKLSQYEDSFNAYGALVNGKGVCMSYSYAFKLLCDLSEIECTVVTGTIRDTQAHSWNEFTVAGNTFEIDASSEIVLDGKPYTESFSTNELTKSLNYTRDEVYALEK